MKTRNLILPFLMIFSSSLSLSAQAARPVPAPAGLEEDYFRQQQAAMEANIYQIALRQLGLGQNDVTEAKISEQTCPISGECTAVVYFRHQSGQVLRAIIRFPNPWSPTPRQILSPYR